MAVTIKHAKTDNIADWTQGDLDAQIALGNYPAGTVLADIVLPSDWNNTHTIAGTIPVVNGGTGQSSYTDGELLIGNSTGNTLSKATLTAGSNITITNGAGAITIASTGGGGMTYPGAGIPNSTGSAWGTSYGTTGANSVVVRDANSNITTNCLFEGFTSQAAGTLITLTAASVQNWVISGSGGQTIKLPDATTLPNGALFTFNNNQTSGTIIVQNNSSTTVATLQSGAFSTVALLSNSVAAGTWDAHAQAPSNVSWSTNTFDYAGSITSATWNGTAIALNRGGTNANLTAVNGGAVYSTESALAITAAGTSGQVLTSSGAGAPTWTTPTTGTVTSVTGTSPIASSGGNTPAISISQATTSTNGYLSSTDWNTFNNKQPAGTYVTSVSATSPVTSSGGTTPTIAMPAATTSVSGYLTSTDWNTFNNKGSGTVTSVAALTLGTTGTDLSSTVATGTTTPVITLNVPTASATNRGVLSSADWTTFNNKGSGTVTSVSFTGGIISVATSTTTPAFTVAGTSGGIPYFASGTTWASSAALASNALVVGGGAGAAPSTITTGSGVVTALGVATNGSGGFVTDTGTVTLTNKTLTNPTITNYTETVNALGTGSSFSPALTSGTVITLTTNANTTITLPTSTAGKSYIIIVNYGGTHTLTWAGGSTIKWVNGTTPTATSVSGKYDIFSFFCDGTNTYSQTVGLNY